MYEFYDKEIPKKTYRQARNQIESVYRDIPETNSCGEHIGKCEAWCCQVHSPSLFYSEFLGTWNVVKNWDQDKLADLIEKCVRQYFSSKFVKGCVFWDEKSKNCSQHSTRPFACRVYGQEPEDEFKPKYERLKVLYPKEDIRPQCDLVMPKNAPSKEQIDKWFNEIKIAESDIGINKNLMNDLVGGSYRTYKDHILLQLANTGLFDKLLNLKIQGTLDEKEEFIKEVRRIKL